MRASNLCGYGGFRLKIGGVRYGQMSEHSESEASSTSSTSSESPYMLLPDSESSQMRLVIEGSDDAQVVTPQTADKVLKLKLSGPGSSKCCLLL